MILKLKDDKNFKKFLLMHFKIFLFLSLVVIVPVASLTCCGWILRLNKVVTLMLLLPSENKKSFLYILMQLDVFLSFLRSLKILYILAERRDGLTHKVRQRDATLSGDCSQKNYLSIFNITRAYCTDWNLYVPCIALMTNQ